MGLYNRSMRELVDCSSELEFDDCLVKFKIVCSPCSMFVDNVKQT